jgi:hypothetical protein
MRKIKISHILKRHLKDDYSLFNHKLNLLIKSDSSGRVILIWSLPLIIFGMAVLINYYMKKYTQYSL